MWEQDMTVRGWPVYPNRFRRVNRAPEKFSQQAQLLPKAEFSSVLPARNAGSRTGAEGEMWLSPTNKQL
jgi:hypothetical protein